MRFKSKKEMVAYSFEVSNIKNLFRLVPILISKTADVEYPSFWQPQTEEIQSFIVDPNSKEFADVQKNFAKLTKIKELLRIQNKLVYKKFFDEKKCLK